VGLHQHDGRLTRWDDASFQARVQFVDGWLARVPDDTLDARLWRNDLLSQQYEYRRRDVRTVAPGLPFGTVSALHDGLALILRGQAAHSGPVPRDKHLVPRAFIPHLLYAVRGGLERGSGHERQFMNSEQLEGDQRVDSAGDEALTAYAQAITEAIPKLRNELAHGSEMLTPNAYVTLEVCCDLINQLFASPTTTASESDAGRG